VNGNLARMRKRLRSTGFCLGLVLLGAVAATQGQRPLTLEAIYDPQRRVDFSGTPETGVTWLDSETYTVVRRNGRGMQWLRVDAASGQTTPLFDQTRLEAALAALPGVTLQEAGQLAWSNRIIVSPPRTGALLTIADDLYYYDFTTARAARLTSTVGAEEEAMFSPDGRFVAFVRANNLFVVEVETRIERALTTDGSDDILNGKLDWLYQEEVYGRGRFRAFWWSPDSSRLAFLQLNQRHVPTYTIVDHIPYRPDVEVMRYPKAGDPNPGVKLGLSRVAGGGPSWVDLSAYSASDFLIVNVDWTRDSGQVVHQIQDREQTWLDLQLADASTGHTRRVLRETTPAWVNENGNPIWLQDGSFLWFSERGGFKHLYRYQPDGSLLHQVTSGRWDVRTLYGVDEATGWVYFAAAERTSIGTDIYRIRLDGSALTRLSQQDGTHRAVFNPTFTHYVGVWSDIQTPTQVRLHRADGTELRAIDRNAVPALAEHRLATPEFVQVPTRDGFVMDGVLIRPPDFNPSRRYPVYQFTYAGPGAAQVRNQWGGVQYMFHQLLAQQGIIVWILDNRSASGQGAESQWPVYGRLGELELQDLEDGVTWLRQQSWVEPSRILLSGWSYGGFMTAYALTHSTSWAAGIAGAPVTDWRDYDTIYTERYMKMPQNNPDGYRRTSAYLAANRLHGRLLLIHGTLDDNVHMQNSLQFAYELQKAGKPFEMMLYPRSRHSISDPALNLHVRRLMFDFVIRVLAGDAAITGTR
jgi:dipeptidyl-peptidase 4